jgi:hypothetical protein
MQLAVSVSGDAIQRRPADAKIGLAIAVVHSVDLSDLGDQNVRKITIKGRVQASFRLENLCQVGLFTSHRAGFLLCRPC